MKRLRSGREPRPPARLSDATLQASSTRRADKRYAPESSPQSHSSDNQKLEELFTTQDSDDPGTRYALFELFSISDFFKFFFFFEQVS